MNQESLPTLLERTAETVEVGVVLDPIEIRQRARRLRRARGAMAGLGAVALVAALILGTTFAVDHGRAPEPAHNPPPATSLGSSRAFGYGHLLFRVPTSWSLDLASMGCGTTYWYFLERETPSGDLAAPCTPITSALTSIPSLTQDTIAFGPGNPAAWFTRNGALDPDPSLAAARVRTERLNGVEVQRRETCGPPLFRQPKVAFCRLVLYVPSEHSWIGVGSMRPDNRQEAAGVVAALIDTVTIDAGRVGVLPVPLFNLADPRNRVSRYRTVVRHYLAALRSLGLKAESIETDHGTGLPGQARISVEPTAGAVIPRGSSVRVTLTLSP